MTSSKQILVFLFFFILVTVQASAQESYLAAENKFTSLLETKLLKTGELVLVEQIRLCQGVNVKIRKTDEEEISILNSGRAKFLSFNELPDNNWVLLLITDSTDDVPIPYELHIISFIEDHYSLYTINDEDTFIDLEKITTSAIINSDELVLVEGHRVYFTDFTISSVQTKVLTKVIDFLKSPLPDDSFLYYRYVGEDAVHNTEDNFESEQLLAFNLGSEFRDLHYLGSYAIFHDESEISYVRGLFEFDYIEQDKTIYDWRQHGQNLRYYTLSADSILTFNKLYLDENEELQQESLDIDLNGWNQIPLLHWDGVFKGLSYNFVPLGNSAYDDDYRGFNYVLNYNLENNNLSSETSDISIDHIDYTIQVDTITIDVDIFEYRIDLNMDIAVTNNTSDPIDIFNLHSNAFEGINCAHNGIKVDSDDLSLDANETAIIEARYEGLTYNNLSGIDHDLCVYALGANALPDATFDNNIHCLELSDVLSTNDVNAFMSVSVFPNPSNSFIRINDEKGKGIYHIYDWNGKLISVWNKASSAESYDIQNLRAGHYLLINHEDKSRSIFTKM